MTDQPGRRPEGGPGEDPDEGRGDGQPGSVRPTGHRPLAALGVLGLVGGWSMRLLALRTSRPEPDVPWTSVALLALAAAILATTALLTRRVVRRDRGRLAHHQAVNRLVLAKASALVGALLLGGYAGYALAQVGVGTPGAGTRLLLAALAALAALAMMTAALLLEHACRVPPRET